MAMLAPAGGIMLVTGLAAYYITDRFTWFSGGNMAVGVALIALAAVLASRRVQGFAGTHSRRVLVRWLVAGAALLALVFGVNALARDWNRWIDLTSDGMYTLSDATTSLCAELAARPSPPEMRFYFFEDSLLARDTRLLVRAYDAHCEPVRMEEVSQTEAPAQARAIVANYETTVVACVDDRCDAVGYPSEDNLTDALLRMTRDDPVRVYFLQGHGGADLRSDADSGFQFLASTLVNQGIDVRAYVGPGVEAVPADADIVIVPAPERDLLDLEIRALQDFLARGGRLLAMLEPGADSNLNGLLENWGFGLPDGILADRRGSPLLRESRPISLLVGLYAPYHPITRKMSGSTLVLAPGARPVFAARKPQPEDDLEAIAYASARAWLESDIAAALADRAIYRDPDEPTGQEIPIAAAGRYPRGKAEARIVVLGDRDLATNRLVATLYSRDLVLNAIRWLAERESEISIAPKYWTPHQDPLTIQQTVAYFYFMAFALPEILLLLGLRAWVRQRT